MAADRIVVMGVAGSGKSTVAAALAARRHAVLLDADRFHSDANVEKMASGVPLGDEDRWPWLASLRRAMRVESKVVVACSALTRPYRDALRRARNVRFIHLVIDRDEAVRRVAHRTGHFFGSIMVDSQFATLETPADDETDVASIDVGGDVASTVAASESALDRLEADTAATAVLSLGGPTTRISALELEGVVERIAAEVTDAGARRILVVPPDQTRLRSRAGEITALLFEMLAAAGCELVVLPATGSHLPMTPEQVQRVFGGRVPFDRVAHHRWREDLVRLGEIGAEEVAALSGGAVHVAIPVDIDRRLLEGWDVVISVGQVVPHEVIGMANFTKNLVVGLGGVATVNATHFLGAMCDMEKLMGRVDSPVRDAIDAAFDRFLAPRLDVAWILTVVEDTGRTATHRGLFVARGRSGESGGAAFRSAAELSLQCNVEVVDHPLDRVSCWLDPELKSVWLANKAVYRTRMALADGGELLVLAPGASRFGEDDVVDGIIRRHGYRGTVATIAAIGRDPELAANLAAAAHLIHGSSEGRFRIVYCTDPAVGGLTPGEVEAVGYEWRHLPEALAHLGVAPDTVTGERRDRDGRTFLHIANPSLGLWATAGRLPDVPI